MAWPAISPVILLTGRPGVGKTTAIKSIVSLLGGQAAGFYTREIRARSQRTGFEIVTLDGRRAWLASRSETVIFKEELPFGKYRVNLRAIDSVAVPALKRALQAGRIIIIDEIGPMEMASELFCQTVKAILAGEAPVVGTIARRPHPFADQVRRHPRVRLKPITLTNREQIPEQIVTKLSLG